MVHIAGIIVQPDSPNPKVGRTKHNVKIQKPKIGKSLTPYCECGEEETKKPYLLYYQRYHKERDDLKTGKSKLKIANIIGEYESRSRCFQKLESSETRSCA